MGDGIDPEDFNVQMAQQYGSMEAYMGQDAYRAQVANAESASHHAEAVAKYLNAKSEAWRAFMVMISLGYLLIFAFGILGVIIVAKTWF